MADWLDDDSRTHSCGFDSAYKGHEILMALVRSAALGGQAALPLASGMEEITLLKESLPAGKVLLSMQENAKEYGG